MAKYNTGAARAAGRGPLTAEARPSGKTHEGGAGYARDARSELFLRATASFAGEDSYYEQAGVRDDRLRDLAAGLAVTDDGFAWLREFLPWLRAEGNIRTAPLMLAAQTVRERLKAGLDGGGGRQLIASVPQRADEPGELLAYWTSRYGRAIPKPVKRGVADAVARLYSERAFLRYDSGARGYRFADVIELVHPSPDPAKPWQGDLFRWAITARHGRAGEPPQLLAAVRARHLLSGFTPAERHGFAREALAGNEPEALGLAAAVAGQWEWLLSWLGEGKPQNALAKADQWRLVLPRLGYMALIRNLRNLDEAGISDEDAAVLAARIADPEQVARSRQLPFRFLSAHLNAPSLRWGHALDKALDASTGNIPELPGRTLILIDTSGSMGHAMSGRSQMTMVQAAALFGIALAVRNPGRADVHGFADGQFTMDCHGARLYGASVLKTTEAFCRRIGEAGHGTRIAEAVRATYCGQDRVVILTDMQTFPDRTSWYGQGNVSAAVPAHIPVYGFNLVGYTHSAMPAGHGNRHELGGLTDHTFRLIPLIEAGEAGRWPWEQDTAA